MTENHGDPEAAALMAMLKEFAEKRGMALVPAKTITLDPVKEIDQTVSDQPNLFHAETKSTVAPKAVRDRRYRKHGLNSFCEIGDRIEVKYPSGQMQILTVTKVSQSGIRLQNMPRKTALRRREAMKRRIAQGLNPSIETLRGGRK